MESPWGELGVALLWVGSIAVAFSGLWARLRADLANKAVKEGWIQASQAPMEPGLISMSEVWIALSLIGLALGMMLLIDRKRSQVQAALHQMDCQTEAEALDKEAGRPKASASETKARL